MQFKFSSPSQKQLRKLPSKEKAKILKKLQFLKADPFLGKKLEGELKGLRSFRVWPYRVIYHYSSSKKLLFIETIEHRQKVYR